MSTSLRAERALTVRSPAIPLTAGQPALVPLKLEGTEGVNSLFHYTLTLQTPDTLANSGTGSNFDLDSFIGLEITCSIELDGSVLASAGKHLRAFANLGIRMMAAKGKVEIQAQDGDMELLAQKMLELMGREGITLESDKLIRLVAGGHAIQITPGAGIEIFSPLAPQFHTAAVNLGTPRSLTEAIQDSPDSRFNETLYLADPDDRPFANRRYELTREDGSVVKGVTAADGGIPIQRSDHPERLGIRILGTAET